MPTASEAARSMLQHATSAQQTENPMIPMHETLAEYLESWREELADVRRASDHTCAAYGNDVDGFLFFLQQHVGEALSLDHIAALETREVRAWLASRHKAGMAASSNARALSSLRNFLQFLHRHATG